MTKRTAPHDLSARRTWSRHHRYSEQLGREWEYMRFRPRLLAEARRWRPNLSDGRLADVLDGAFDDLEQLAAATDDIDRACADADCAMLDLVGLAQQSQLAGRIVIHRILPGLIARSARYRDRHDGTDPAEIAVPAAWLAIARYDIDRRQRHVAAALISDTVFQAFRQPLRRRATSELIIPSDDFTRRPAPTETPTALEQLAEVMRLARVNGLADAHLQLVRELVQVGSPTVVAANRGVTTRTIRNHRDRAVADIRACLDAA